MRPPHEHSFVRLDKNTARWKKETGVRLSFASKDRNVTQPLVSADRANEDVRLTQAAYPNDCTGEICWYSGHPRVSKHFPSKKCSDCRKKNEMSARKHTSIWAAKCEKPQQESEGWTAPWSPPSSLGQSLDKNAWSTRKVEVGLVRRGSFS